MTAATFKLVPSHETPEWRANLAESGYSHSNVINCVLAAAPVTPVVAPQSSAPVARLQMEISDRPYTEGESYFDVVILDRPRCADGMLLFAAPVAAPAPSEQDKIDAERYRFLRNPTADVALVLDKQTGWVPPDELFPNIGGYHTYEYRAGEELDAAIDAARAAPVAP